jgi:hypothetical protein
LLTKITIISDRALERADFSFKPCMRKHHTHEGQSMGPHNLGLGEMNDVQVHQAVAAPLHDPYPRADMRPATKLVPLAHDQPPPLLLAKIKIRHGSDFGRLLVRGLNRAEVLPALPND